MYHRRWYQSLCHFFSLKKSKSPEYLFTRIPQKRQLAYNLRNLSAYEQPTARTICYSKTCLHNTLFEWNLLDKEIQNCTSLTQFKRELLSITRPLKSSAFRLFDIPCIKLLTRFLLHLSDLNEHRLRHVFDCITPVCLCGLANEDSEHLSALSTVSCLNLFDQISDIPGIDLTYFDESSLCNLLYGNPPCIEIHNSIIIESTITYINATGKLNVRLTGLEKAVAS